MLLSVAVCIVPSLITAHSSSHDNKVSTSLWNPGCSPGAGWPVTACVPGAGPGTAIRVCQSVGLHQHGESGALLPVCHFPHAIAPTTAGREHYRQYWSETWEASITFSHQGYLDLFVTLSDGLDQSSKFAQRRDFLLRPVMTRPVQCSVHRPGLVWVDPGPRSEECAMVASPLSSHHAAACRTGETIASKATRPVMQMMEILAAF